MAQKKPWRQIFTPIHTWTGLICGWLLFVIFFAGSLSVFTNELNLWMRPEIPQFSAVDKNHAFKLGIDYLQQQQPKADFWRINPPTERDPYLSLYWGDKETHWAHAFLSPDTGELLQPRDSKGGMFFTEFHHELYYVPHSFAYVLLFILSCLALATMVAGVVIHKRIFVDFFSFHKGKKLKSWLDAHNLLSVLPLPFHFMIIYSGAMILGLHGVMTAGVEKSLGSNDKMFMQVFSYERASEYGGKFVPMPDLLPLLAQAEQDLGGTPLDNITINNPNTEKASLVALAESPRLVSSAYPMRIYDVQTGKLVRQRDEINAVATALGGTFRMHLGIFADYPVLWLYFLCGLAGSGMIATGSIMWIVKRKDRKNPPLRGIYWVERLNLAVLVGFPLACLGFFYANRLLPLAIPERAEWEVHCLFLLWLVATIFVFYKKASMPAKWRILLKSCAYLSLALPLTDILVGRAFWQNLWLGDWVFLSVELSFIAFACLCLAIRQRIKD